MASHASDVIRWGMTSRLNQHLTQEVVKANMNALDILNQVFDPDEVLQFRELQQTSGAIVSGSSALELFEGQIGITTNLDLYVSNQHRWRLRDWLRKRFEWKALSRDEAGNLGFDQGGVVQKIIRFSRPFKGLDRTIHCLVTEDSPVEAILLFKLTCTMNFFTHKSAYSLFPADTFIRRTALITQAYELEQMDFYDEYRSRGWEIPTPPLNKDDCSLPKMENEPAMEYMHSFRIFYAPTITIEFSPLWHWALNHSGTYAFYGTVHKFVELLVQDDKFRAGTSVQTNLKSFLEHNYRGKIVPGCSAELDRARKYDQELLETYGTLSPRVLDEVDSDSDAEARAMDMY
ncbi:hypothetical protein BDN72DRAFT_862273 [Pluteus cervinus]|uniref:Uncharacterized protein n=1 Tax=Pluteus cervinus TaxID=181527 RepID=A0ACD3ACT4_9AGAR|nr:hypothetical protein BDN72DRAFT_862273 [Pluteus cervinus]